MEAAGLSKRGLNLVLAVLATSALASAAPAAAKAAPGLVTASATVGVPGPSGAIAAAVAHCPRGTRAVSGGYDSIHSARAALLVHVSKRVGARSWRVSAYKVGSGGRRVRLTAIARCRPGLGSLKAVSEELVVPAPSGQFALRTARPQCSEGRYALSGGFEISVNGRFIPNSPPVAVILGSRSGGRSCDVTAARLAPSGASRMTAFAYCAEQRPFKRGISAIFPAGDRPRRLTSPTCPRGMVAVSGGFLAHFPMGAAPGIMIPINSGPAGARRWTLTGVPQNERSFVSSYAYCI